MAMQRKRPLPDKNQYYVYVWRFHGEVIYVGQGKNNRGRANCRASWGGRRWELTKLLEKHARKVAVEILPCKSQQHSRKLESKLILKLSPKYNRAPHYGGFAGMHTVEGIARISKANTGRTMSRSIRLAQRARMLGNQNLLGHRHSLATKLKISNANKNKKVSALCRRKSRERMILRNRTDPPRKGKTCSIAHRRKLSKARRLYHASKI